jgi:hypothetical protein
MDGRGQGRDWKILITSWPQSSHSNVRWSQPGSCGRGERLTPGQKSSFFRLIAWPPRDGRRTSGHLWAIAPQRQSKVRSLGHASSRSPGLHIRRRRSRRLGHRLRHPPSSR